MKRLLPAVIVGILVGIFACQDGVAPQDAGAKYGATLGNTTLKAENILATGHVDVLGAITANGGFPVLFNVLSGRGLEVGGGAVGMLSSCTTNQVLQWSGTAWVCATVSGGGGTVSVTAPITGTGSAGAPVGLSLTTTTCSTGSAETATAANGTSTCSQVVNSASAGSAMSVSYSAGVETIAWLPSLGNLQGTGSAGNLLRTNLTTTTCSAGSAETATAADGTSTCSAVVTSVGATANAGTVVAGTAAAPTLGLISAGCTSTWVMTWNGTSWACAASSGGSAPAGTGYTHVTSGTFDTPSNNLGSVGTVTTTGLVTAAVLATPPISISISASQNNWIPTGWPTSSLLLVNPTAAVTVTGMSATGVPNGQHLTICNVNASNTLTLANLSSSSLTANQFTLAGASNWPLIPSASGGGPDCTSFVYSTALTTWIQDATLDLPFLNVAGNLGAQVLSSSGDTKIGHHLRTSGGTAVTTANISSCGTTPAVATGSTDLMGTITTGTGSVSSCVLTFPGGTFTNPAFCQCTQSLVGVGAGGLIGCTATATALTVSFVSPGGGGLSSPSTPFTYFCGGS